MLRIPICRWLITLILGVFQGTRLGCLKISSYSFLVQSPERSLLGQTAHDLPDRSAILEDIDDSLIANLVRDG